MSLFSQESARVIADTPFSRDISATPDIHSSSELYAKRFSGPVGEFLLSRQTAALLELLKPWPGARVLDIGGGHGQIAGPLTKAGYHVTVLSSTAPCNEYARGRLGDLPVKYMIGSLTEPPVEPGSFDIVTSFRIMSHVEDWQGFVQHMCRAARFAVVCDFAPMSSINFLTPLLFNVKKRLESTTRQYHVFQSAELFEAFETNAFHDPHVIRQFFWPMALHRVLKSPDLSRLLEATAAGLGLRYILGSPAVCRLERKK